MPRSRRAAVLCAAVALAASAGAAAAQTNVTETQAAEPAPTLIDVGELADVRGGQEPVDPRTGPLTQVTVLTDQQLTATNTGNSVVANNYTSGSVSFPSSLDFNGIGNFVVNTGANNNLQGAITVNIGTVPAP